MCIAAPGKVIKIENKIATVSYPDGQIRKAKVLDDKIDVGNFVMVQMGLIINVLNKKEVESVWKIWQNNE